MDKLWDGVYGYEKGRDSICSEIRLANVHVQMIGWLMERLPAYHSRVVPPVTRCSTVLGCTHSIPS